jgi:hypothetical protein
MHRARLIALLPLVFLLAYGCSGAKQGPAGVSGKITYKGQPVTGGTIYFFPEGSGSSYSNGINEDGTYLVTDVPSGDCSVSIEALPDPGKDKGPVYGGERGEQAAKAAEEAKAKHKDKSGMGAGQGMGSPIPGGGPSSPQGKYMKLPEKYADPKTSGLKANIKKGSNTQNFDLTD